MLSRYAQRIFQKRFESTAEAVKNLTSKNVGPAGTGALYIQYEVKKTMKPIEAKIDNVESKVTNVESKLEAKIDKKLDRIGSDLHKAFETLGYLRASFDKSKK
ncbi:5215_t:CDS:2 [Rhizophagus irregularis]|nr:5215_t:CDS:2 [Rhizophagus irregularis]